MLAISNIGVILNFFLQKNKNLIFVFTILVTFLIRYRNKQKK